MRRFLVFLPFLVSCIFLIPLINGCRHKPDLTNVPYVSFSGRVLPIIQSNCAKSGCHDGNQFSLRNYDEIRSRITPENAHASNLYQNMIYLEPSRVMPPPPDQPMSEQQLQTIYTWIMQGAKDN